jgi:hypothetical protein
LKLLHYGAKYFLIGGSLLLAGGLLRSKLKSTDEKNLNFKFNEWNQPNEKQII